MSSSVWVFMGAGAANPSAVFSSLDGARDWIEQHSLSGMITEYPVDVPVLDWAIAQGYFKVKQPEDLSTFRRETFTSGAQRHHHFSDGQNG